MFKNRKNCYRFFMFTGTPLLPPELEHFNTPQLLEAAGDSRSQSPTRDDKVKATKKKQDGLLFDKRERELSKVIHFFLLLRDLKLCMIVSTIYNTFIKNFPR